MFEKIDRIVIAVNNLQESAVFFSDLLGIEFDDVGGSEKTGMKGLYSRSGIELITGTGPETAIGKFLKQRGEGLWAIVIKVTDIAQAVEVFTRKGLRCAGQITVGALKEAAFHPKDAHGVEIVLVEYPERHPASIAVMSLVEQVPVIGKIKKEVKG